MGCASGHLGVVLVEKRRWYTANAVVYAGFFRSRKNWPTTTERSMPCAQPQTLTACRKPSLHVNPVMEAQKAVVEAGCLAS